MEEKVIFKRNLILTMCSNNTLGFETHNDKLPADNTGSILMTIFGKLVSGNSELPK